MKFDTLDTEQRIFNLPFPVLSVLIALARSREHGRVHVFDHISGELAGFDFGGSGHEAFKIVRDSFLLDGALDALFDQIGGFIHPGAGTS